LGLVASRGNINDPKGIPSLVTPEMTMVLRAALVYVISGGSNLRGTSKKGIGINMNFSRDSCLGSMPKFFPSLSIFYSTLFPRLLGMAAAQDQAWPERRAPMLS